MLPNGPRESERILRGTRVAWKQMLALTGTQASDGKVGPLQVVVGLGADKGGGGVWTSGRQETAIGRMIMMNTGVGRVPIPHVHHGLSVRRNAHSVRNSQGYCPVSLGAVPWGEDPSPLPTLPHSLYLHLQRILYFLRSVLYSFVFVVNCLLQFFCGLGNV